MPSLTPGPATRALDEGRAYVELDALALTLVAGGDARAWLHDLVTTDVGSLERSRTRPSLLLTPTGRIRAAFHVLRVDEGYLLAQAGDQWEPIGELLARFVLSSDVEVHPAPGRVFAVPGGDHPPEDAGEVLRPSVLGGGFDVLARPSEDDHVRRRLEEQGLEPAPAGAAEARRIRLGEPRFPTDLDAESLPAEAGWDEAPMTDRHKGCFLGQESVAKVANLGHPTRSVVAVRSEDPLRAGEIVRTGDREVGMVTSAEGTHGIARIRWDAVSSTLTTASGAPLVRR
ncbi:MAG: CAF17-like 4Fe-4S cluster assembly/insertion protein YgfZ [Actinomycetota bacterium]